MLSKKKKKILKHERKEHCSLLFHHNWAEMSETEDNVTTIK